MTDKKDGNKLTRYPKARDSSRKEKLVEAIKPPSRRVRCPTCGTPYSSDVGLTQCKRCNRPYIKDDPDWDLISVANRIGGPPNVVTTSSQATAVSRAPQ
jgi:hypothetical protein